MIALGTIVGTVALAVFIYFQEAPGVVFRLGDQVPPGTRENDAEFRLFLSSAAIGLLGAVVAFVGIVGFVIERVRLPKR